MENITDLKKIIDQVDNRPGVYRFVDSNGKILYVGKAKKLHNRLTSYLATSQLPLRLQKMVSLAMDILINFCETESQALILETNWIKQYRPPFNILMKDDKSFPYLALSSHEFPRLFKYRGRPQKDNRYFGPYPSTQAMNETFKIIQTVFKLRTCSDVFFKNRVRPCLLYQINRCSAPCTGEIQFDIYKSMEIKAIDFLSGKTNSLVNGISEKMTDAAQRQEYEKAREYRDMIQNLNAVLKQGKLTPFKNETFDIISLSKNNEKALISLLHIENGQEAQQSYHWIDLDEDRNETEILESFLPLHCADRKDIKHILTLTSLSTDFKQIFKDAYAIKISHPLQGEKHTYLENLHITTQNELNRKETFTSEFRSLSKIFSLPEINRIDVFDNSHLSGTNPVGGMIVATSAGFEKNLYRTFTLDKNSNGNDLLYMTEMLSRRYKRAQNDNTLPSVILLDGGRTQMGIAKQVLEKLGLHLPILAIAKGENRHAGNETVYTDLGGIHKLSGKNLFFLERLRDEAHRFVIGTQRNRRTRKNFESTLDKIKGVGAQKREKLLHHFGSIKNIEDARLMDLKQVDGIHDTIAENIYQFFHKD